MLGKIISMLDMLVHMQHYALRDLLHSRKLLKRKKKTRAQCRFKGVSSKAGGSEGLTRKGREVSLWQPWRRVKSGVRLDARSWLGEQHPRPSQLCPLETGQPRYPGPAGGEGVDKLMAPGPTPP